MEKELKIGAFSSTVKQYQSKDKIIVMAGIHPEDRIIHSDHKQKYYKECRQLFTLRHPNVVQFYGIFFLTTHSVPVILTEKPETNLHRFLQHAPKISLSVKVRIFVDIAHGLSYLHSKEIVRLDLTTECILLDSSLVAKICKIPSSCRRHLHEATLPTHVPIDISEDSKKEIDVFSFGHLMLHTCTHDLVRIFYYFFHISWLYNLFLWVG